MLPSSTNWGTRRQWTSRLCPLLQILVKTTHCRTERRPLPPSPLSQQQPSSGWSKRPCQLSPVTLSAGAAGSFLDCAREIAVCLVHLSLSLAGRPGPPRPGSRGRWLGASPDCGLGGRLLAPDNYGVWGEERSAGAIGEWLERGSAI